MTNREWMLKQMQSMSDEDVAEMIAGAVYICNDQRSKSVCEGRICDECTLEWLRQEHKEEIKLSEVEKVILENLDKRYEWIARDEDGHIYVYETKPYKDDGCNGWLDEDFTQEPPFSSLFAFLDWSDEEPYNIRELLKRGG